MHRRFFEPYHRVYAHVKGQWKEFLRRLRTVTSSLPPLSLLFLPHASEKRRRKCFEMKIVMRCFDCSCSSIFFISRLLHQWLKRIRFWISIIHDLYNPVAEEPKRKSSSGLNHDFSMHYDAQHELKCGGIGGKRILLWYVRSFVSYAAYWKTRIVRVMIGNYGSEKTLRWTERAGEARNWLQKGRKAELKRGQVMVNYIDHYM